MKELLTLQEFLVMRGVYADDIYGDYQDYIEVSQRRILGESEASKRSSDVTSISKRPTFTSKPITR